MGGLTFNYIYVLLPQITVVKYQYFYEKTSFKDDFPKIQNEAIVDTNMSYSVILLHITENIYFQLDKTCILKLKYLIKPSHLNGSIVN